MNEAPKEMKSWRILRRTLIGLTIFATLVAIFYTEEDWRGKRAWENCKRELEAKGAVLDWDKYIPPPIPDDKNFFTVNTNFYLRFVKLQTEEQGLAAKAIQWLNLSNGFPILDLAKLKPVVAEIIVMTPSAEKTASGIKLTDAGARQQLQDSLRAAVGRDALGSASFKFSELQLSNPVPAKIVLLADAPPSTGELEKMIPPNLFTNLGQIAVTATVDPKIFQVRFVSGRVTSAAEYLAWGDRQFGKDLDEVREALKRPYAMIPGDYSTPYAMPIPNFVMLRSMAQTLSQRTQCYLLLNQPAEAFRELALMHDVCKILERPPTGKPETLVEAMINVAITGLYVATVQEGFRLHGWQEPQIKAIQPQLAGVNLPPLVAAAFASEQAGTSRLLEKVKLSKVLNLAIIISPQKKQTLWDEIRLLPQRALDLAPQGWIYQNMAVFARQIEKERENILDANQNVTPKLTEQATKEIGSALENNRSPFYLLAKVGIPNVNKAMQSCAYNQTLANQAQIACALERFRLANGEYPETLDALAPQFIETIPHDIIGGEPLHYRRTADGKFLLYSVGWNETDDDGTPGTLADVENGDWVWKN
jgi:tetratricopeptide (TPR) repeat protein